MSDEAQDNIVDAAGTDSAPSTKPFGRRPLMKHDAPDEMAEAKPEATPASAPAPAASAEPLRPAPEAKPEESPGLMTGLAGLFGKADGPDKHRHEMRDAWAAALKGTRLSGSFAADNAFRVSLDNQGGEIVDKWGALSTNRGSDPAAAALVAEVAAARWPKGVHVDGAPAFCAEVYRALALREPPVKVVGYTPPEAVRKEVEDALAARSKDGPPPPSPTPGTISGAAIADAAADKAPAAAAPRM
jgi:hypothetical protein